MTPLEQMLFDALEALAAPAGKQEAYLREFGTWPCNDELALDLDAVSGAYIPELSPEARRLVDTLDAQLATMSGPNPLWDGPALYTAPEWTTVRELARAALAAMGTAAPEPSHR